ncbi:hypothetical protein N9T16_03600 [Pelagibacteraceae bacterium]|nr:hypothetical protein [Pelagibacteraceae bacterium]
MKKINQLFLITFFLIFIFAPANAEKVKYIGQELSGEIKLTYETKVILPLGMWEVSAMTKKHQYPVWMETAFVQIDSSKIKAILIVGYPKEPVINGWYEKSDTPCDDYDGQQSNFHEKKIKTSSGFIMSGSCSSIYANTNVDRSLWDKWDIMRDTHEFIAKKNVKVYPSALIHIESNWFTKENAVEITYAYNPEFNNITSKRGHWTDSEWSKYKIDDFPTKKDFMNEVIYSHKLAIDNSINGLKKRKPIDLSYYDFR